MSGTSATADGGGVVNDRTRQLNDIAMTFEETGLVSGPAARLLAERTEPFLVAAEHDGFRIGRGPVTDPTKEREIAALLQGAMNHNWHGNYGYAANGHGPVGDCVQCEESARVLARVVLNQILPAATGDPVAPAGKAEPTRIPRSRLTLDEVRAKVSGLHFAKESLTDGEREILHYAEGLLRLLDDRDPRGCAR